MPAGFPGFAAGVNMDDAQNGAIELDGQPLELGHKFARLGGIVYALGGVTWTDWPHAWQNNLATMATPRPPWWHLAASR